MSNTSTTRPETKRRHFASNLSDLPLSELEVLAQEVHAAIQQKKNLGPVQTEARLIHQINTTVLGATSRARYLELAEKLEDDSITEMEHREFMQLVGKDERLRNKRVKLLIELAQIRHVSLAKLMETLGLTPAGNS
ncbi:MAG: hypothetical protein ABMA02_00255 [Saprospiraceae bacterium]